MEYNQELELLKEQLKNNIMSWYPQNDNAQYIIIKDFCKRDVDKLKEVVEKLNENGKILILMNNRLSIRRVCINNSKTEDLYSKKEIEELLDKMGLTYKKFYYPLPSCEMTNVIFTDKHLPDEETISRNVVFNEADDIELNKENELYKDIIKQDKNLFKILLCK